MDVQQPITFHQSMHDDCGLFSGKMDRSRLACGLSGHDSFGLFIWGTMKEKVYADPVNYQAALQERIIQAARELCTENGGSHLKQFLWIFKIYPFYNKHHETSGIFLFLLPLLT